MQRLFAACHPPRRSTAVVLALLAGASGGCAADEGAAGLRWRGSFVVENGAVEVRNPAEPLTSNPGLSPEPLWRAPAATSNDLAWEQPIRIAAGPEALYVLDAMAGTVHVVSRAGTPQAGIGRRGRGPGELQSPYGIALVGARLAVGDSGRGTVELFTLEGEHAGTLQIGRAAVALAALDSSELLLNALDGHRIYTLEGEGRSTRLPPLRAPGDCVHVGTAGADLLQLDCATPEFRRLSPDGIVLRTVRTRRRPVRASTAELNGYRERLAGEIAAAGRPGGLGSEFVERQVTTQRIKRLMRGIRQDPGTGVYAVWQQEPAAFGGGPARLHLFGSEGIFVATLAFDASWVDFTILQDTVYALEEEPETGLVSLAAYAVLLPPGVDAFMREQAGGATAAGLRARR